MYIFILEGGETYQGKTVAVSDLESSDAGVLDVICIDGNEVTQYHDNEWHLLQKWGD